MWLYILGGIVGLFVIFFAAGLLYFRHSLRVAVAAVRKVKLSDVEPLCRECQAVFRDKFAEILDLNDLEGSAKVLSARLNDHASVKRAFAKKGFYWYFVLPIGAFMGELLRIHAKAEWKESEGGGLEMTVPVSNDAATTYPFHKVLKQAVAGDLGDIYAYLTSAKSLEKVLSQLPNAEG
jgi:hypothetical protein